MSKLCDVSYLSSNYNIDICLNNHSMVQNDHSMIFSHVVDPFSSVIFSHGPEIF